MIRVACASCGTTLRRERDTDTHLCPTCDRRAWALLRQRERADGAVRLPSNERLAYRNRFWRDVPAIVAALSSQGAPS